MIIITIGGGTGTGKVVNDTRFDEADPQEWVEGQSHKKPHVGDVVIKADGTRVTLEATKINGTMVLGWSPTTGAQGVDPYSGYSIYGPGELAYWDASKIVKDEKTGCVFSSDEWMAICTVNFPTYEGKYEGELGGINNWYNWNATVRGWQWCGPRF